MQNTLAMLLAFGGYSLLNVSQAVQTAGLQQMDHDRRKGWTVWGIGTVGTALPFFIILAALKLGQVSSVGPMAATGLPAMILFSKIVLKRTVAPRQLAGIGILMVGGIVVGLVGNTTEPSEPNMVVLISMSLGIPVLLVCLWFTLQRRQKPDAWAMAALAGTLAGVSVLFQKTAAVVSQINAGGASTTFAEEYLAALLNPLAFVWLGATGLAFLTSQIAFKRGPQISTIPTFVSGQIIMPVVGGYLAFGEEFTLLHLSAVVLILVGVHLAVTGGSSIADKPARTIAQY